MSGIRPMIDAAVASAIAEHPKYFTELGLANERARTVIVRKIMAALRGDGVDKPAAESSVSSALPVPISVEPQSREGRAYANLRRLAGASTPFLMGTGQYSVPPSAACEAVYALAALPDKSHWTPITHAQMGAWGEFFRETLPNAPRRPMTADQRMPWPWPPSATGKVYDAMDQTA